MVLVLLQLSVHGVSLAEVNLLFNFQRILLDKFTAEDILVMFVEALAALENSEA